MIPDVAIVVSPRDWAEGLHRFVADHGGARVRARVLDAREAVDERYDVLVAEDLTSFLTPRLVAELQQQGRRVLGVFDDAEPWGRQRLTELGVDEVLASSVGPEALLHAVEALAIEATSDLDAELRALGAEPTDDIEPSTADTAPITVFAGPPGGAGRTELAVGVAQALAESGRRCVLVDADDVAPAVAQRLGLALHPNLRSAVDVVEHWSGQLADVLQPVPGSSVGVLAGLASGRDASEIRPAEARATVDVLARGRHHVVIDVGSQVEDVPGLGSGHGRFALTRAMLDAADLVVAVGDGSPVGVTRLLDWIASARGLTDAPLAVAINRVGGSFERGELEAELTRTFQPAGLWTIPDDKRVREAAWAGELVRRGPFRRSVAAMAADIEHLAGHSAAPVAVPSPRQDPLPPHRGAG
ncbi:MAG: hypothetical protein R3320_00290 [Nitriliruptorales bacterium]|nr:hypothetical protein [Nitriliruptorales bacterium]